MAAVGLLYATVRRGFGASGGTDRRCRVCALTPVASRSTHSTTPRSVVFLLVGRGVRLTRALEETGPVAGARARCRAGFLTKMMQAA